MGDDVSVFALLTHSCKQVYNKGMWSRLKQDRQDRQGEGSPSGVRARLQSLRVEGARGGRV